MTAAERHLVDALHGAEVALRAIGFDAEAEQVKALHDGTLVEADAAVELLAFLGSMLVGKYLRANHFFQHAPEGIRQDALVYARDCFAARCWVAAARSAARRVVRGEELFLN